MQADLAFFPLGKKRRGIIFVGVQTYTRKIFATAIKSTRADELIKAIGLMIKVSDMTCAFFISPVHKT